MKLHFHGANYDRQDLNVSATDKEVAGKYRGVGVSIHQHLIQKRHNQGYTMMTYRGVTYIQE